MRHGAILGLAELIEALSRKECAIEASVQQILEGLPALIAAAETLIGRAAEIVQEALYR